MRVLFALGNGYLPEFSGGVQSSTDHLARLCQRDDHDVAVLCSLFGDGWFGLRSRLKMKLSPGRLALDKGLGYPVYRAWHPKERLAAVVERFKPDVAVVQCHGSVPIAREVEATGTPLVLYFRNVEFDELDGDPGKLTGARFIANSQFTADTYRRTFGLDCAVVRPTIRRETYATERTPDFVTFINVVPKKGLQKACEIARAMPDVPFLFLEGWKLDEAQRRSVDELLADLPNLTFENRTDDMRSVYSRTKILLAPSMWEEAWGRVASEAHCSGIPVVGSDRGGLGEAIGPGGIALDYDAPLDEWVDALRGFWENPETYAASSAAALAYSKREELDPESQFETFMSVLREATND